MYTNINKLISVSKDINIFLKNKNNLCVERTRNNNIIDAISFKLMCTREGTTQEKATITLNSLRKQNTRTTRQSLAKKEKNLDADIYVPLADKLATIMRNMSHRKCIKKIVAVDGTYPTLLESMTKDGFIANKSGNSVTPLVTGLFNVTYNYPVALELAKTKNERSEFLKYIKNKSAYNDTVFVFDRGYQSDPFFDILNRDGIQFVCRIKKDSTHINHDTTKNDTTSEFRTRASTI